MNNKNMDDKIFFKKVDISSYYPSQFIDGESLPNNSFNNASGQNLSASNVQTTQNSTQNNMFGNLSNILNNLLPNLNTSGLSNILSNMDPAGLLGIMKGLTNAQNSKEKAQALDLKKIFNKQKNSQTEDEESTYNKPSKIKSFKKVFDE